jgi:hypothetical protein
MTNKRKLSILINEQVYRWLEAVIRNRPESFYLPKGISTVEELGAFAVESFVDDNTEYYAPLPDELVDSVSDEPIEIHQEQII